MRPFRLVEMGVQSGRGWHNFFSQVLKLRKVLQTVAQILSIFGGGLSAPYPVWILCHQYCYLKQTVHVHRLYINVWNNPWVGVEGRVCRVEGGMAYLCGSFKWFGIKNTSVKKMVEVYDWNLKRSITLNITWMRYDSKHKNIMSTKYFFKFLFLRRRIFTVVIHFKVF